MSIELNVIIYDREAGELPADKDRIVAFTPDNPDPTMRYRTMDGMFFRISGDARYWFSLTTLGDDFLNEGVCECSLCSPSKTENTR